MNPGGYGFHLFWGLALERLGDGVRPGFDRSRLPMPFWGGAEHLRQALALDPGRSEAPEALARMMDAEGQFGFSYPLWQMAARLTPGNREIRDRRSKAAAKAYLQV